MVRIFSPKCSQCRQRSMVLESIPYTTQIEHDGRKYQVSILDFLVPRCSNCSEVSIDREAEQGIDREFRREAKLLAPEQIRNNREALGLTQRQLAASLKIAEATLSRWETGGQVQQRSLDTLLRLFFGLRAVRDVVTDEATLAGLGSVIGDTTVLSANAV